MNSEELRKKFIEFFKRKGHIEKSPASLVPSEIDQSVLFTTAGMQQFKRFYTNPEEAPAPRIVTIQPCVRTSDIEEIGDETHLTFFEMLGNFSFGHPKLKGSYFKKEAIEWAWEFLTDEKWFGINKERISATYFSGGKNLPSDNESLCILQKLDGLKIIKPAGFVDNFWSLGVENSPGGPTVEFYVDNLEVWNLVFNEYIFKNGKYEPQRLKGVDTGMGLERLVAVMQGKKDVFETDLFLPVIQKIEKTLNIDYKKEKKIIRTIVDHSRTIEKLIEAGIIPGKNKRESVLKTLLRVVFVLMHDIKADLSKEFDNKIDGMMYLFNERFKDLSGFVSKLFEKEKIKKVVLEEYTEYRKLGRGGIDYYNRYKNADLITGEIIFDGRGTFGLDKPSVIELWKRMGKKISPSESEEYKKAEKKHQEISRAGIGTFKGGLVDQSKETIKLHTAAHLLHAALREVLGKHVFQKGSNINSKRLRFDFSHPEKLTNEQIKKVEDLVNEQIKKDLPVKMEEMTVSEAKKSGALGVFDERYGERVKVYTIGPSTGSGQASFSREICGGPHAKSTGELGHFKIINEQSSSAGVRRIKARLNN